MAQALLVSPSLNAASHGHPALAVSDKKAKKGTATSDLWLEGFDAPHQRLWVTGADQASEPHAGVLIPFCGFVKDNKWEGVMWSPAGQPNPAG